MKYTTENKVNIDSSVTNLNQYKLDEIKNNDDSKYLSEPVFGGVNSCGVPVYGSSSVSGLLNKLREIESELK